MSEAEKTIVRRTILLSVPSVHHPKKQQENRFLAFRCFGCRKVIQVETANFWHIRNVCGERCSTRRWRKGMGKERFAILRKKKKEVKPGKVIRRLDLLDEKNFYLSREWKKLRYEAIVRYGRKCQACGDSVRGLKLHVDHIKPRSKFPELQMDINNLQVLCEPCNMGKGAWDETDHR